MSFSPEWNTAYDNGQSRQKSMTAILYSLFLNTFGNVQGKRMLELGCGVGNNAAVLIAGGAEYHGVDGSRSAIEEAQSNPSNKGARFYNYDFTASSAGELDLLGFDIVFDRAAVSHNDTDGVKRAIAVAYEALKPGGAYVGSDWFSTAHSEFVRGTPVDARTRTDYPDGQFIAIGNAHFTDERELRDLFSAFEIVSVTERVTRFVVRQRVHYQSPAFDGFEYRSAVWDLVMRKPA